MEESRVPGNWSDSPVPLYHVSACPIPVGRVLLPHAVGRERASAVRLAISALGEGSEALALLLAGDAWKRLRGEGEHVAEMILPGGALRAGPGRGRTAVAQPTQRRLRLAKPRPGPPVPCRLPAGRSSPPVRPRRGNSRGARRSGRCRGLRDRRPGGPAPAGSATGRGAGGTVLGGTGANGVPRAARAGARPG